jgi:hypothetical protein
MAALIPNNEVETCLRECMTAEGFILSEPHKNGETGVDLLAKKGRRKLHIEIIGFKSHPPTRSRDFYEIVFRALSRLNDGAREVVIALPARFGEGLPSRAHHYGAAWRRIGEAFPELRIWLVSTSERSYRKTRWNDWLN